MAPTAGSTARRPASLPRSADVRPVDVSTLARIGTALADETRRRILVALLDGPTYPSELAQSLELSRPNVSNHLSCLRAAWCSPNPRADASGTA